MPLKPKPDLIFQATIGTAAAALTTTSGRADAGIDVLAAPGNSVSVFIGTSTAVTTSTGFQIPPGGRKRFLSTDPSQLFGIAGSASQSVCVSLEG
jgi:hypothetical protein